MTWRQQMWLNSQDKNFTCQTICLPMVLIAPHQVTYHHTNIQDIKYCPFRYITYV
jgi:hypothetical protein